MTGYAGVHLYDERLCILRSQSNGATKVGVIRPVVIMHYILILWFYRLKTRTEVKLSFNSDRGGLYM